VIVGWQWVHYTFGVYFPDKDLFHNNAAYAEAYGQNLSDFGYRLCGSFSEPSALAYYFSGALFFAYRQYELERSHIALASTFLSILLLFMSTSTSAYLILVLFFARLAFVQAPLLGRLIVGGTAAFPARASHALWVLAAIGATIASASAANGLGASSSDEAPPKIAPAPQPAPAPQTSDAPAEPAPAPVVIVQHVSDDGAQVVTGSGACKVTSRVAKRCS